MRARPSLTLRGRTGWSVLALAPAVVAVAVLQPTRLVGLGLALAIGLALEATALRQRGLSLHRLNADPAVVVLVALVWLWLGSAAGDWRACALATALAVGVRVAFGGSGQSPFHPAAVGLAATAMLGVGVPTGADPALVTLAIAAGAVPMLAKGLLKFPALAGWALGLGCGLALAQATFATLDAPGATLVGVFVLSDAGSAGIRPGPRFAIALGAGLLAATLPGAIALPAAVLLANFLAPALETAWPQARPA